MSISKAKGLRSRGFATFISEVIQRRLFNCDAIYG